jgi:hypothetical protein
MYVEEYTYFTTVPGGDESSASRSGRSTPDILDPAAALDRLENTKISRLLLESNCHSSGSQPLKWLMCITSQSNCLFPETETGTRGVLAL